MIRFRSTAQRLCTACLYIFRHFCPKYLGIRRYYFVVLGNLTKNLAAQSAHNLCAVLPLFSESSLTINGKKYKIKGEQVPDLGNIMFRAFIAGNIVYYAAGIILAVILKDNRAFCKYLCPITVFLKPMGYFSLMRIKCYSEKCVSCGKCRKACPMNVDMTYNSRKRENGTECILCMKAAASAPLRR